MRADREEEKIETTVGDLVAAVSDAAFELSDNKREAHLLARLTLEKILEKASLKMNRGLDTSRERLDTPSS